MTGVVVSGRTEIPVRNLWLLMLYASKLYQDKASLRTGGVEENPGNLPDLVAEILANAVEVRLQRSLGRDYRARADPLTRVRGQIDVLTTEREQLLSRGRIACRFTELSVDNPRNRLVRAALAIAAARARDRVLARRCRQLAEILVQSGVSPRPIGRTEAESVSLGRNDVADVESVDAARLMLAMDIPTEEDDGRRRRSPQRDVDEIRRLYEAAVRGFYRATLPHPWKVYPGEKIHRWPVDSHSAGALAVLPVMRTDTVLETTERRIIVETKFADALKPGHHGAVRLSRNHVFQLYAYVQSQSAADLLAATAEGVLLYPVVGQALDESVAIQGHRYRFMTVNLAGAAADIRRRLLDVTADSMT